MWTCGLRSNRSGALQGSVQQQSKIFTNDDDLARWRGSDFEWCKDVRKVYGVGIEGGYA